MGSTDEPGPGGRVPGASELVAAVASLVEPLGRSLPPGTEVVLHDLSLLPDSIVAVWGEVTGRRVGDPATDVLLEQASTGTFRDMVGYRTRLPDGRTLRSTTAIVRTSVGDPVAALCINADVTVWQSVEELVRSMTGSVAPQPEEPAGEVFARDVDELAAHLVHEAIREQRVPVELMKKEHKLAVVRTLRERGMFLLRDAVETVAAALGVTRFTIYNYLNEIDARDAADAATAGDADERGARRRRT